MKELKARQANVAGAANEGMQKISESLAESAAKTHDVVERVGREIREVKRRRNPFSVDAEEMEADIQELADIQEQQNAGAREG